MISRKARNRRGLWFNCWGLTILLNLFPLLIISLPNVCASAEYPTKSIQIIVAAAPGGGSDLVARLITPKISASLKQSVVVVNKPGGAATLGPHAVLAAPADGYTILLTSTTLVNLPFLIKGVTYDFFRDFTLINLAVTTPIVIAVRKDAPWLTLEQLIADAKRSPGKFTYASGGAGSTANFAGELIKMSTGTNFQHVPTGGGSGPIITGILGGHINIAFFDFGMVLKLLEAGSIKALAVMNQTRLKELPDVPTTVEKGLSDLTVSVWFGFAVRSETPRSIIEKLENVFKEALSDKEMIAVYEKAGNVVENLSSEQAIKVASKEFQKLLKVAKAANMLPQ